MGYGTALITGASSGLGRALGLELAAQGTHVVLCARRVELLEEVAAEIRAAGGRATVRALDVSDGAKTADTVAALDEELGGLDLVIANAGVGVHARGVAGYTYRAMAESAHVNFCGALATLTGALPQMVARNRGHLVGVCSLASFGALPGSAAYCAPKAGLSMFLDCLHMDLAGTGVAVTTVNPGFIRTPMTEHADHPLPQLMSVENAARLILDRLPLRPAVIDFPQPLAFVTRLSAWLPRFVRGPLLRWLAERRPRSVPE